MTSCGCAAALSALLLLQVGPVPSSGPVDTTNSNPGTVKSDVPGKQSRPTATLQYGVKSGRCAHGADAHVSVETPNGSISTNKKNEKVKTSDPTCGHG